jgi:hypothetical protein
VNSRHNSVQLDDVDEGLNVRPTVFDLVRSVLMCQSPKLGIGTGKLSTDQSEPHS